MVTQTRTYEVKVQQDYLELLREYGHDFPESGILHVDLFDLLMITDLLATNSDLIASTQIEEKENNTYITFEEKRPVSG